MPDLSRRKVLQISAVIAVSGMAGCSSQTNSTTPSQADTDAPTTETPIPAEQITKYESLTVRGRDLFQTLLSEDSIDQPSDTIPTKLWEATYVRHEGSVYSISKTDTDRNIAEYTLEVSSIEQSQIDESDLVTYSNLSEEEKNAFKQSLNEAGYTVRNETLPSKLNEGKFVKYNQNYYELRVLVGDIRVWRISITEVSN